MKKRLLTSIAAAVVLTSTIAPASNISAINDLRSQKVSAATTDAQAAFLNKAAKQAVKAAKKYGTYPSVMIAQAIVESGWGESGLAVNANNLFGMKAGNGWRALLILLRLVKRARMVRATTLLHHLENTILLKNHLKIMVRNYVKVFLGNHFATKVLGLKMPILMPKQPRL